MFGTVRVKLVAAIISLLVIVASAFGTLSYQLILGGVVRAQEDRLQQTASYEAAKINWALSEYGSRIEQIALSEATERYASASAYYSLDRLFLDNRELFPILSYIDDKGHEELKFVQGKESSKLSDLSGHALIRRAFDQPNKVHLKRMDSYAHYGPTIGFAYSVRNFFGEYGGTILGIVPLNQIAGTLSRQRIGQTGYFLLVDHAGSVLVGSQMPNGAQDDESESHSPQEAPDSRPAAPHFTDEHVASASLKLLPWIIHAVLPRKEFFAEPRRLIFQLGLIAAAVLLLAGTLAWAIGSAVMRPLNQLMGLTEAIGRGDFSKRSNIQSGDEFEHLSKAFNRMIEQRSTAEENLKTARDMAAAGERVKSEFLATMSHEIRTPLNGVIGMAELLGRTELSAQQREYLETINYSGHYLGNLINDILDFSKIEAGEVEMKCEDLDLRSLVDEVALMLAASAQEKGLDLCVLFPPDAPTSVRGDAGRLRQVLVNIVGNAVKFTDSGEIVIRVLPLGTGADSVRYRFEIVDTGIGIDSKDHERIFESFRQSDEFQTRRRGGTGLGLAICRQLVEFMGGQIGVDSTPGRGTCMWFELDLSLQPDAKRPEFRAHELLATKRVLVADRHPATARIIADTLRGWGARCQLADSAAGTARLLQQKAASGEPFDLVILEHSIFSARLRRAAADSEHDKAFLNARIIVIFDYHAYTNIACDLMPASAARLRKPVHLKQLHDVVIRAMSETDEISGPENSATGDESSAIAGRVLVIEDNPVNLQVLRTMLEVIGCEVDSATDGCEGVDAALAGEYDLIFMDCQMPGMDGYEATRCIRSEEQANGKDETVPIVALTANAMTGDRERCLGAGMTDYLSKPFTEEQLRFMLSKHVKNAGAPGNGATESLTCRHTENTNGEDEDPIIDSAVIEKLRKLQKRTKRDVVGETIMLFQESSKASMHALREAILAGDAAGIRSAAHNLKSSSYLVGAKRLGDLCKQLEENARKNRTDSSTDLFERVEPEYESVRICLGSKLAASG